MLTIGTWNVNGIRAREGQVADWVTRDRPDIVCLQEIKASGDQVPAALCFLEGYWCYWHGDKGYSGVALHVRRDTFAATPSFSHPAFDHERRIVAVRLGRLTVLSVYVPNGGKDFSAKMRFLDALERYAAEFDASHEPLVVCGDLNVARADIDVHPKERKPKAIGQLPEERTLLERIIGHGLVDIGRTLEPENDGLFTWWPPWRQMRQRNIGWRIDYVLASRELAERALVCRVFREHGTSDHAPLLAQFDIDARDFALPDQEMDHAREMPAAPARRQPSLFDRPADAAARRGTGALARVRTKSDANLVKQRTDLCSWHRVTARDNARQPSLSQGAAGQPARV
jgi:exodeoxyribonuclease-3